MPPSESFSAFLSSTWINFEEVYFLFEVKYAIIELQIFHILLNLLTLLKYPGDGKKYSQKDVNF